MSLEAIGLMLELTKIKKSEGKKKWFEEEDEEYHFYFIIHFFLFVYAGSCLLHKGFL